MLEPPRTQTLLRPSFTPVRTFVALDYIQVLIERGHVPTGEYRRLPEDARDEILEAGSREAVVSALVDWRLLTAFQGKRILANETFGLVIGNYRVLDRIGNGGMSTVYRGEHRTLRSPVAIKAVEFRDETDPRVLDRFRNEVDMVSRLSHPNIVAAIDVGGATDPDDQGATLHYYVMEYVRGADLERMVQQHGPLPIEDVCLWGSQIALALAEAQRHRMVHRDVKPSNVIIGQDGRAKLLDFGLALCRTPGDASAGGHIVGTLDYMAPEQFEDPLNVDTRADVYSLGAVLFWCLTGRKPFPSAGRHFYDFSIRLTSPAPSPRALRPDLPRPLDLLVRRMLMLHRHDRIDSPREVAHVLERFY